MRLTPSPLKVALPSRACQGHLCTYVRICTSSASHPANQEHLCGVTSLRRCHCRLGVVGGRHWGHELGSGRTSPPGRMQGTGTTAGGNSRLCLCSAGWIRAAPSSVGVVGLVPPDRHCGADVCNDMVRPARGVQRQGILGTGRSFDQFQFSNVAFLFTPLRLAKLFRGARNQTWRRSPKNI